MSPVTPNPAAEFSTFAITRSRACCSTSAGIARRAISRPGLPKMSPMKRIRILRRGHGDAQLTAAALPDARQDDAKLACCEGGRRAPRIERAVEAYGARKAAECTLRQMKRRLGMLAAGREFAAADHHDPAAERHLHVVDDDARQIHDDFDRIRGL